MNEEYINILINDAIRNYDIINEWEECKNLSTPYKIWIAMEFTKYKIKITREIIKKLIK